MTGTSAGAEYIRPLHRLSRSDEPRYGGKSANLGELLTAEIPVPVNVLVVPRLSLAELADLGVRRVSTGSLPYRAAIDAAVEVAENVRDGVPPRTATAYPAMQGRLVEFDRLNKTG